MPSVAKRKLSEQPIVDAILDRDRFPVLRSGLDELDVTKRNPTVGIQALAKKVGGILQTGLGPNAEKSLLKEFRFFRKADRDADDYGGACFETDIDYSTCCTRTVAIIEFYRESNTEPFRYQELTCVYDSSPTPAGRAYIDGSFTGDLNPSKFVVSDSLEAQVANIPILDPTKTDYVAGTVVQYTINGEIFLYKAAAAGGPFAAPTSPDGAGTADWLAVAKAGVGLTQYHTLGFLQNVLATGPDFVPGLRYDTVGDWNGSGDPDQMVYVRAATATTFEGFGELVKDGVHSLVEVDVAAGTAVPVQVDLSQYATKQQIADLIGAAPAALDTLAEIAAQLQADEQGTAAILVTQQQHTQQIAALQTQGGRSRGPWLAATDYKKFDWVIQNDITYYAKADFTSGATFDATKWTQFGAGLTPAQVLALNPLTYPVMGVNVNGLKGYDTLEAAAAAQCFDTTLNRSVTITKTFTFLGTLRANGSELRIPDGLSVKITVGNTLFGVSATATGPNATGQLLVYGASATADVVSAIECPQLVDCQINCAVRGTDKNGQGITARGNTELANVVGTAQLYLYDLGRYLSADGGIVVNDRRPERFAAGGGGGGTSYTLPAATDTRLGGVKVGSGLAVTADGTLSVSGGGGGGGLPTVYFQAYAAGDQGVASQTIELIRYDSLKRQTGATASTGFQADGSYLAPVTGLYAVGGALQFQPNASGTGVVYMLAYVNDQRVEDMFIIGAPSNGEYYGSSGIKDIWLSAGDRLTLKTWNSCNGGVLKNGNTRSSFYARLVATS